MQVAFQSNEIAFQGILHSCQWKRILDQLQTLRFYSELFFCQWTQFLKLGVNHFSSIFSITNSRSSFYGQWKWIFIECIIPASGNGFSAQCSFFSEQILCQWKASFKLRWSHFLYSNVFPTIRNHFLRVFSDIPAGESSFFTQWKRIFLTNLSFLLVESEFLSIGNSILLFTAFFSVFRNHYYL